ncbi:hypothetical protein [Selenomonas sp. AB3002]|uniref:hypothetical protein n=1 Tax=Selenomonas sp. AB3002 TaxID=1392502 RepID=UPI000496204B
MKKIFVLENSTSGSKPMCFDSESEAQKVFVKKIRKWAGSCGNIALLMKTDEELVKENSIYKFDNNASIELVWGDYEDDVVQLRMDIVFMNSGFDEFPENPFEFMRKFPDDYWLDDSCMHRGKCVEVWLPFEQYDVDVLEHYVVEGELGAYLSCGGSPSSYESYKRKMANG